MNGTLSSYLSGHSPTPKKIIDPLLVQRLLVNGEHPKVQADEANRSLRSLSVSHVTFQQWWSVELPFGTAALVGDVTAHEKVTYTCYLEPMVYIHFRVAGVSRASMCGRVEYAGGAPEMQVWALMRGGVRHAIDLPFNPNRFIGIFIPHAVFNELLKPKNALMESDAVQWDNNLIDVRSLYMPIPSHMLKICDEVFNCSEQGIGRELFIQGRLIELLRLAVQEIGQSDITYKQHLSLRQSDIDKIYQVRDFILSNMQDPGSISDLAARAGIGVNKLKSGFPALLGETVFGYLRNVRLERAAYLLRYAGFNVDQAAYAVGYASPSHFTQVFRKRFDVTPSDYRQLGETKILK